jgi:hypothetical protein
MLPSIASPVVSLASGAATLAQPVLGAPVAAPKAVSADAVKTALAVVDSALGIADELGILPGATKPKPSSSGAGYAAGATAAKSSAKTSTAKSSAKTSGAKASKTAPSKSTSTAKKSGPLAFLDDPKLSVEDKLMRLLAYLNDKWEKDLQKKMKDLGAKQGASTTSASASTKKKSGGILGGLGGIVKAATSFFPAAGVALEVLKMPAARAVLAKVGGPVLAAAASAVGFPELAPLALKYGPQLVDLAAGIATSAESAGATSASSGTSSASSAPASTSDGAGLSSDRDAQLKLMEMQRIIDQQKEMFSLVSNMLRATHEGRMAVIQNVR